MNRTRSSLWLRVALIVAGVLVVESAAFSVAVRSARRTALELGYTRQLVLLEDSGALDVCDADPTAWQLPTREGQQVIPLRPDGAPWRSDAWVPAAVRDLAPQAQPGEVVRIGSPWLAWPAVIAVEREGPCSRFYLTPPDAVSGAPMLRLIVARLVLAGAIVFGLLLLVVRPLTRRIEHLARQTRALATADFDGRVDEGSDELGTIGAVINQASARARSLIDAEQQQRELLHELFADLAHDVRTPLASVKLTTDALAHGDDPHELLPSLRAEVEYLDAMFANLATVARLRTATLPIERRPGDLRIVVEHVGDRFAGLARDRGVSLDVAVPGQSVACLFDPLTLEQAIANLVHNALKYAEAHVAVVLDADADRIELRVINDGVSVQDDEVGRLTERRYRGARQGGRSGMGLGLAIATQIIERHGGRLRLAPWPDGGTVARVRLDGGGDHS